MNFDFAIKPNTTITHRGRLLLEDVCDFNFFTEKSNNIVSNKKRSLPIRQPNNTHPTRHENYDLSASTSGITTSSQIKRRRTSVKPKNKNWTLFQPPENVTQSSSSPQEVSNATAAAEIAAQELAASSVVTSSDKHSPAHSIDDQAYGTTTENININNSINNNSASSSSSTVPIERDAVFYSSNENHAGNRLCQDLINFHRYLLTIGRGKLGENNNTTTESNEKDYTISAKSIVETFVCDYGVGVGSHHYQKRGRFFMWITESETWQEINDLQLVEEIISKALKNDVNVFVSSETNCASSDYHSFLRNVQESKDNFLIKELWKHRNSFKSDVGKDDDLKVGDQDVIIEEGYYNTIFDQLFSDRISDYNKASSFERIKIALVIVDGIVNITRFSTKMRRRSSLDLTPYIRGRFLAKNAWGKWQEVGLVSAVEFTIKKLWKENDDSNPSKQFQMSEITQTDVLCGRGGLTNYHVGNKRFRDLVNASRKAYVQAPKTAKNAIAKKIVNEIKKLSPPGRFLKRDEKTELWYVICDRLAAEKTSQALREKSVKDKAGDADQAKISSKNLDKSNNDSSNIKSNGEGNVVPHRRYQKRGSLYRPPMDSTDSASATASLPTPTYVCSPMMSKLKDQVRVNANTHVGNEVNMRKPIMRSPEARKPASADEVAAKVAEMKRRSSIGIATMSAVSRRHSVDGNALNLATTRMIARSAAAALSRRNSIEGNTLVDNNLSVLPRPQMMGSIANRRNSLEALRSIEMARRMSIDGAAAAAYAVQNNLLNSSSAAPPNLIDGRRPSYCVPPSERNKPRRRGSSELMQQARHSTLAQQLASMKDELEALVSSDSEDE